MTDETCDILIIGAGPAGATAAMQASSAGAEVIVIDKAHFPRDKCCGDGLTAGALQLLDQVGLDPGSVPSWNKVEKVTIYDANRTARKFQTPASGKTFTAVARRSELDFALVELARSRGISIREGTSLEEINPCPTSVQCCTNRGSIEAKAVIAADGMWSPTRKLLGLSQPEYRGEWHAFRQYFSDVSPQAQTELIVMFEPDILPGYLWSFPLANGAANVGLAIKRSPGQSVQPMKALWADLLQREQIKTILGNKAQPEAPHRAWPIPANIGQLPLAHGRVIFVGDAAAVADPLTGEGIGQALETGILAAKSIMAAGLESPAEYSKKYIDDLSRGMKRDHKLASGLSKLLETKRGSQWSLELVASSQWSQRQFVRWLFEDYPRAALLTPHRWKRKT